MTGAAVPGPGSEFAELDAAGTGAGLSGRLTALAGLIQIGAARSGSDGFSKKLLHDSEELLARAGERLRLSARHTVVALAGGTGSGKSSLFNRLAGADFSTVGVTRPITRDAHACVWGVAGSGPLLEWLAVPRRYRYARSSALDRGEEAMAGLVLLDLPDHDSVVAGSSGQVDRLVELADLMVWVLDPQKYADSAVHRRFLVPLAGHAEVVAVVLNQTDLLTEDQTEDCISDLRRLLDSEGLHEAAILVTSAVTGTGLDELRKLLIDAVTQRRAASARISADVDVVVARFAPYVDAATALVAAPGLLDPDDVPPAWPGAGAGSETAAAGDSTDMIPAAATSQLVDAFCRAAGVSGVGDSLESARELRAIDYVGWPVAWLVDRLTGRDPVRKTRLGKLWAELRTTTAGPSGAQQAEIDNALTQLADEVGPPLPKPWSRTVRAAVRSRADEIPAALGTAIGESLPAEGKIEPWWWLIGAAQGLLLGAVIVGLAWIGVIVAFGVFHAAANVPRLFADVALIPWICVMLAAFLFLGWLTASGCMNLVRTAARREHDQVESEMRAQMAVVAREMVVAPAEQELSEYHRFREDLRTAAARY
ncbi:MAG: GTPase [Streptosporangiaceae bacterium]|jgi:GTP-binding protein EngB required for normal cell division